MTGPSIRQFIYVGGNLPIPNSEIVGRRINRHICPRCGNNSDNGDCGHRCGTIVTAVFG